MSQMRRERVAELQRELASLPNNDADSLSLASSSLGTREQLLQDLDDIMAADCVLCGESVIRQIRIISNLQELILNVPFNLIYRLIDAPFTVEDDLEAFNAID